MLFRLSYFDEHGIRMREGTSILTQEELAAELAHSFRADMQFFGDVAKIMLEPIRQETNLGALTFSELVNHGLAHPSEKLLQNLK